MPLRLIDVVVPKGSVDSLKGVFRDGLTRGTPLTFDLHGDLRMVRAFVDSDQSGRIVEAIEKRCGDMEGFRLSIQRVEAVLPKPEEPEPSTTDEEDKRARKSAYGSRVPGISRAELSADVFDMTRVTRVYVATVVLSTVVAVAGLLAGNAAAIIGAMVIAPLLGPNVGLALGTSLYDTALLRQSVRANLVGVSIALLLSTVAGLIVNGHDLNAEILSRTQAGLGDVVLALAAGAAGTLALTTGVPASLVGVMVAVALLPPTTVCGLMLGRGAFEAASGAALLLATNVICINLAGALTFRLMGVRPGTWWEAERAKRASRIATGTLSVLLALVIVAIVLGVVQHDVGP